MPKRPIDLLEEHLDACRDGCTPWSPVCQTGRALVEAATKAAVMIHGLEPTPTENKA